MITFNDIETVRSSQEYHKSIALKYFFMPTQMASKTPHCLLTFVPVNIFSQQYQNLLP